MKIAPSILASDFSNLKSEIKKINESNAEYIHLDVMDGNFVPNISFGADVIQSIRPHTNKVFDVHLMIQNPHHYIDDFIKAGSDIITFHIEAVNDDQANDILQKIKNCGIKAGLVVKPNTPISKITKLLPLCDIVLIMSVEPGFGGQKFIPEVLSKVKFLKEFRLQNNYNYEIEIDGGINFETAKLAKNAGVDVLVAGTYLFKSNDFNKAVESLR